MKTLIKSLFAALALLFIACEASEDRNTLTNSFSKDDIQIEVIQPSEGSNIVTLKMTTKGVMGEWDYGIGRVKSNEISFVVPSFGTYTYTYTVFNQYIESNLSKLTRDISKSVEVTINKFDASPGPAYDYLVGPELQSKTWVFAGVPQDGGKWFYKSNPNAWDQVWWNMGGTTAGKPVDHAGEMTFDLLGGTNLTYKSGDTVKTGTWSINSAGTQLNTYGDATILGAYAQIEPEPITQLTIAKLNDTELVLHARLTTNPNDAWTWVFKPKGE